MLSKKEKDAVRFLRCCNVLEENLFQLYHGLARKIEHPDLKSLLVGLAYDGLKHSKIVKELSKNILGLELEVKDCRQNLGQLWKKIRELSQEISEKEEISDEDFPVVLRSLTDIEDLVNERYSAVLQLKTLQYIVGEISKLAPVDLEILKGVFEAIVRDKENHRDVLIEIIYFFATKELERTEGNTPIVKYQNPNGWNRPINM